MTPCIHVAAGVAPGPRNTRFRLIVLRKYSPTALSTGLGRSISQA